MKKKRIQKYSSDASAYLSATLNAKKEESSVKFSLSDEDAVKCRKSSSSGDNYDSRAVSIIMRSCASEPINEAVYTAFISNLKKNLNQTFADKLLYYIRIKSLRTSAVYKAAQVDKRLFSKIISDPDYTPSKDTAIALAIGLKLSLDETNDLLARAGYALSHSNQRDVIIEYFFNAKIYNLFDINEVLLNLNQKIIGRF
ncbi:MAG: hypothetical protein IJF80_01090 [Clostridia bacterium]|nr:hypothetical protein [Clostridia bacterium]